MYNLGKYDRISEKTAKAKGDGSMIYLFCVLTPLLLGRGALRAFYGKKSTTDFSMADNMVLGGIVVIGLAEIAHMGAIVLGQSFSQCIKLFLIGLIVLLMISVVFLFVRKSKEKELSVGTEKKIPIYTVVFGILVLLQGLQIVFGRNTYVDGDMTVEMVNSMLSSDSIYQINPMTGQAYTLGMPLRLKILCLPTLYGILCDIFGMNATTVVWIVVPVVTLCGCYAAYYTVSKALFDKDSRKQWIFMIIVALILWISNSMYGLDGFGVQYAGFRGVSIRMGILLPYTVGLVLRKKWLLVALCIFAEACIVWTLYGMGMCLLVALGMFLAGRFFND